MRTLRIFDGKQDRVYHVPQCYAEMDAGQFVAAVLHLMRMADREVFWHRFVGMKPKFTAELPEWVLAEMDSIISYIPVLDESVDRFLLPHLPLRKKIGSGKLYSPAPMLADMSFQQFMTADSYFSYYCVTQREQFIDRLVASLYLQENEVFVSDNENDTLVPMEEREAYVHKYIPAEKRFAVFVNWILIKNWLSRTFVYIFPRGKSDGKPQASEWLPIFDAFVGENVPFMREYQRMPCMDALRIIDGKIKQQHSK